MVIKTIKGIDDSTWAEFKSLAARDNTHLNTFFKKMVHEYKKKSDRIWDDILHGEKILSDKEAEDMLSLVHKMRKEPGFRE
jgi:hypothetical protein